MNFRLLIAVVAFVALAECGLRNASPFSGANVVVIPYADSDTVGLRVAATVNGTKKIIRTRFTTVPWPRFRIVRLEADESTIDGYGFGIGCHKLVEFEDNGTVPNRYDANDTKISRQRLWSNTTSWSNIQWDISTDSGVTIYTLSTSYQLIGGGNVTIKGYAAARAHRLNATNIVGWRYHNLSANAFKWSVTVQGYPFVSTTSLLSLKCFIHSVSLDSSVHVSNVSSTDDVDDNNEGAIFDTNPNGGVASFNFENTYVSGSNPSSTVSGNVGTDGPIDDSQDPDPEDNSGIISNAILFDGLVEKHKWQYFVFRQDKLVFWDPTVAYNEDVQGVSMASANNVAIVLVLIALIALLF